MILSRYHTQSTPVDLNQIAEREGIRLACTLARPLRPIDVQTHLNINHRTAVRTLQALCSKDWLAPIAGAEGKKVVKYVLQRSPTHGF